MKRDLIKLASNEYDLLVIGGGIYGFCVARDAILRGLSVGLVEKGDFGHATSFNTLRVIHGGFRYLQSLDIMRSRQSFTEQMVFMEIAPLLVRPLPDSVPVYGHFIQGEEIERLNDFMLGEIRRDIYGLSPIDVQNLISSYGSAYTEVLENSDKLGELGLVDPSELIRKAKILHAIREEMAHNLSDVLFRRTDLGMDGKVDNEDLITWAEIMAQELHWNRDRIEKEVEEVTTVLTSLTLNG